MNNRPLCVFFVANAHTLPGLTTRTARGNEAAAIKSNQSINQSTGWRRRIKINGCSRNSASSGSQLPSKEPKQYGSKRIKKRREVYSGRPRLSMITPADQERRSRAVLQLIKLLVELYSCFICRNYTGTLIEFSRNYCICRSCSIYILQKKRKIQAFTCLPGQPEKEQFTNAHSESPPHEAISKHVASSESSDVKNFKS